MPRIDNISREVIEMFQLDFNEEDPGRTPPIDLVCLGGH
jgi:hypothetical protein